MVMRLSARERWKIGVDDQKGVLIGSSSDLPSPGVRGRGRGKESNIGAECSRRSAEVGS